VLPAQREDKWLGNYCRYSRLLAGVAVVALIVVLFKASSGPEEPPSSMSPRKEREIIEAWKKTDELHSTSPEEGGTAAKEPTGALSERVAHTNRREGIRRLIFAIEWIWAGAWMLIGAVESHSLISDDFVLASTIGWTPYLLHRLGAWVRQGFHSGKDDSQPPMTMKQQLRNLIRTLRATGRYTELVRNLESATWPVRSYIFEAIFAREFEAAGCPLRYEVAVNNGSSKSIDFVYPATSTPRVCFELVSPRMSNLVRDIFGPHPTKIPGVLVEGASLSSDTLDEKLRPEAQAIRLQEKLLEKVGKFPEPAEDIFAVLVVDCTDFHFGMLDREDCRMLMFGRTRYPYSQEFWRGARILGLLNEKNPNHGSTLFHQRASAVILLPELTWHGLPGSYLVLNNLRSLKHRAGLREELSRLPPVASLVEVTE